jgi:formylglycine-generating enzyme required for sulfatase activity/mono/diheme cytochrome c family protein
MKPIRLVLLPALSLIFLSGAARAVDFKKDVQPILESACVNCHGPEQDKGGLRLHTRADALKGGDTGPVLKPGKPDESPMYTSTILPPDHDEVMPPKKNGPLAKQQTEVLRDWIAGGAVWPADLVLKPRQRVDFVKHVQPILEVHCVACHQEGKDEGGLRLDTKEGAFKGGDSGAAVVAGDALKSPLFTATVLPATDDELMPPKKKGGPLAKELTETLKNWIDNGAIWPDGVKKLVARKAEGPAGANETVIVQEIYNRIITTPLAKNEKEMQPYTATITGTDVTFDMVPIPGGRFKMGSPEGEPGRKPDEGPVHEVEIAPFWMGKCEVTWNEFELFMYPEEEKKARATKKIDPALNNLTDAVTHPTQPYVEMSFGMGKDGYPAISMTQHAANKYCEWISAKTGEFYRLPTEAEWEYACRAGTTTPWSFGSDPSKLREYAWFGENSDFKYQKVGKKKPNPWGLHDMHGNVIEWVLDQYAPDFYAKSAAASPWNKATKPYPHSARGGSWDDDDPLKLRSAARRASDPSWKIQDPQLPKSIWYHTDAQFLGFRVVRPLKVATAQEMFSYWNSGVEKDVPGTSKPADH